MPDDEKIRVVGLRDLQRELKALDLQGELKEANWRVAQIVLEEAEKRARALGRMQAKAAESLTAGRAQRKATVAFGGARYPFAFGAEFGAKKYPQFLPHLGRTGYWLYPAIRDKRDEIVDAYGDEIERLTKAAFPD